MDLLHHFSSNTGILANLEPVTADGSFPQTSQEWLYGEQPAHTADLPAEMHRGVPFRLPPDLHSFVHDESQPAADRAHALLRHLDEHSAQMERAGGGGMGTHWTVSPSAARSFATRYDTRNYSPYDFHHDPESTQIILHARTAEPGQMIRSRRTMREHDIFGVNHSEGEIPLRKRAPVHLTGISWAANGKDTPLTRHDFPEPIRRKAGKHTEPGPDVLAHFEVIAQPHMATWWHGTNQEFKPGDHIEPGHTPVWEGSSPEHVYFTDDPDAAESWAQTAADMKEEGRPRIYQVEPTGHHEEDPEYADDDIGISARQSRHPLRVIREAAAGEPSFYHASDRLYAPGDRVTGGHRLEDLYIADEPHVAASYYPSGHVYEVQPEHAVTPSKEHEYTVPSARVVRRLSDSEVQNARSRAYNAPDERALRQRRNDAQREHLRRMKEDRWYRFYDGPDKPTDEERYQHALQHEAAARPGRGEKVCPCCKGNGEHPDGSECDPCDGQGTVHKNEPDRYCPGQPQPRRRHWREAGVIPAAERHEDVSHILAHYKPTDFGTWDEVRGNIDWTHPKWREFVDDVRASGVRRPIPIDYEAKPPRVKNGHTRLLAAELAGVQNVPTRQHHGFMDPDDPDEMGRGPDDPEHWSNREASMARTGEEDTSYRVQHQGPDADSGEALHELGTKGAFPPDVHEHPEWYDGGDDLQNLRKIRKARGNPEERITMYRAMPSPHHKINTGDWVTLSREYALQHAAETDEKDDYAVLRNVTRAKYLRNDGNSLNEWSYHGPTVHFPTLEHRGGERGGWKNRQELSKAQWADAPHEGAKKTAKQQEGDERPFGDYTMRYRTEDQGQSKPHRIIEAFTPEGAVAGRLNWYGTTGTIKRIEVAGEEDTGEHGLGDGQNHRRKGLATAMWNWGREIHPKLRHSGDQTDMGADWAKAVGGPGLRARDKARRAQDAFSQSMRSLGSAGSGEAPDVLGHFEAAAAPKCRLCHEPLDEQAISDGYSAHDECAQDHWCEYHQEEHEEPGLASQHNDTYTDWGGHLPFDHGIHRGFPVVLPGEVHRVVHDQSRPLAERAQALRAHLDDHPHNGPLQRRLTPEEEFGDDTHLGVHWTDQEERAKAWGEDDYYEGPGNGGVKPMVTHVTLHAASPDVSHIEDDPDELERRHMWGFDHPDSEHEVPLRIGAPVHLTGLSWKRGGETDWRRYDFPEPMRRRATGDRWPDASSGYLASRTAGLTPREDLPPDPGTRPIPEGHIRLWHYTPLKNVDSIREHGLQRKYARGDSGTGDLSEPSAGMWASTKRPDDILDNHEGGFGVVEFHAHPDEISRNAEHPWGADPQEWAKGYHHVIMQGDVHPSHILDVHEPWHGAARYMRDDDPSLKSYQWVKDDPDPVYEPYRRGLAAMERQQHTAALQVTASDVGLAWDEIGERYPRLYGDPDVHGEAAKGGDGEGVGWAANILAHDRPEDPGAENSGSWDMRFHQEQVDPRHIDWARHENSDPRVQHAYEGYSRGEPVPPVVLVHRHGIYQVADGHHRVQGAARAGKKVDAYVAYSPYEDEPFSGHEGEPPRRGPFHDAESHPGVAEHRQMQMRLLHPGEHTGSLQVTAAIENPHTHGDEWYHGSPHAFGSFGDELPDDFYDDGGTGEPEPENHWNTLLGHHFAASHKMAEEFAHGDHPSGYFPEGGPKENIVHARLEMKNPKHYASEHDMDQEVYEHEWKAGNHIHSYLDPELEEAHNEGSDVGPEYDYQDDHERMRRPAEADPHYRRQVHPYATGWLTVHPDKHGIAERFRERLQAQGHDGITYGNEFEGRKYGAAGRICAIPFHEHQIAITQRHTGPKCLSLEEAARQQPLRGQQMLPFEGSAIVAHFEDEEPEQDFDHPEYGNYDDIQGLYHHPDKGWHCPTCQDFHGDAGIVQGHQSAHTDWDRVYPHLPEHMHRGFAVELPARLHEAVHGESLPAAERGHMLLEHLAREPHGMHWTPSESQADHYATISAYEAGGRYDQAHPHLTEVMLHARKPAREDIETDPDTLANENVLGLGIHKDQEIPIRHRAPVHITGISWKRSGPGEFTRHDLSEAVEHTAAMEVTAMDENEERWSPRDGLRPDAQCPSCGAGTDHAEQLHLPMGGGRVVPSNLAACKGCGEVYDASKSGEQARLDREVAQMAWKAHQRNVAAGDELFSHFTDAQTRPLFGWGEAETAMHSTQQVEHVNRPFGIPLDPDKGEVGRKTFEVRKQRALTHSEPFGAPGLPEGHRLSAKEPVVEIIGHFKAAAIDPWLGTELPHPHGGEPVGYFGNGLRQVRHPADLPGPLYHGSNHEFAPGDRIEPGHPGNFVSRMKHVYMTEQPEGDEHYKGARGYGPHVYEVRPTGPFGHRRDARGIEWATEDPLEVIRRVPDPRKRTAVLAIDAVAADVVLAPLAPAAETIAAIGSWSPQNLDDARGALEDLPGLFRALGSGLGALAANLGELPIDGQIIQAISSMASTCHGAVDDAETIVAHFRQEAAPAEVAWPETAAEIRGWRCPNCGGRLEYAMLQNSAWCPRCEDLIHRSEADTAQDWEDAPEDVWEDSSRQDPGPKA